MQITVVLVIKNRSRKATERCLNSLANQNCVIILVDYGSSEANLIWEREMCCSVGAILIEGIRNTEHFNKSRALNIGIKCTVTDYVMCGDIDLIYQPNFIEEAEKALQDKRLITCKRFDLNRSGIKQARERRAYGGCITLPRKWLKEVHGFDEKYTYWGAEDDDVIGRALFDNFEVYTLPPSVTYCVHQWHPESLRPTLQKNREYFTTEKSLIRNLEKWGER